MMRNFPRPSSKAGRTALGIALIAGGTVGFLPIVGFWMIPLGLLVLSEDFAGVRRFRRRWTVKGGRVWNKYRQRYQQRRMEKHDKK